MKNPTVSSIGLAFRSVVWILVVQVLVNIIAFAYLHLFEIDLALFNVLHVYFKNEPYGTPSFLIILGFDVGYLLSAPKRELVQFYPTFAGVIWIVGLIVRNLIPVILSGVFLRVLWLKRVVLHGFLQNVFKLPLAPIAFLSSLGTALIFYFCFSSYSCQPVEYQILLARIFLAILVLYVGVSIWFQRKEIVEPIRFFLFEPILPYSLSVSRILFFSYTLFLYLVVFRIGHGNNIGLTDKVALPGIGWLIEITPVNASLYSAMCYVGAFLSLMILLGFKTRFFLIVNCFVIFYVVAVPNFFGKLWHEQLIIWISWLLAASPCADVLSLDSIGKKEKPLEAKPSYGFHLKVIWLHFGLIYFFAGFYKLWIGGFDWALSNSIVSLVQIEWFENYDVVSRLRVDRIPMLLKAGGLVVILFELFYIIFLFSKKTRWISVVGGLVMHNMIGLVMYISFFTLLQVFYLVFIPWNWIFVKLGWVSENIKAINERPKLYSLTVLFPLFVLGMNALYGVLRIDSYPFSIYPVYCDILPENVKHFDYRVRDIGFSQVDYREEGRKVNFRWEDFSRHEYYTIEKKDNGQPLDTAAVRLMWKRWQIGVPALRDIDSVDVFVVERPLNPEKSKEIVSEEFLVKLYPDSVGK